ncbi:DUF6507 family protein [Nocardiopsis baichengensis]|uniref:DUF6507 family protein n=1 Tax=Nocardiopsis baichengensis TaxID=280240 RepID=UPI00036BCC2E|nr:DUF6507 family protein [Nocardiopsis baichengensis]
MSGWDIDSAGVGEILGKIGTILGDGTGDGLAGSTNGGFSSLGEATTAAGSGIVEVALSEYFQHFSSQSQLMFSKTVSASVGCSQAVQAYLNGDIEMAERAQGRVSGVGDIGLEEH